jgi:hypothetical protein
MGLGPWALALGGASSWAFSLGAPSHFGLAWVFWLLGACASRLPPPPQTFVNQQHGCHLLPHAISSVLCDASGCPLLGWAGFVCRGGSCALGGPWVPPPTAQPMRALRALLCCTPFPVPSAAWTHCPCNVEESGRWLVCGGRGRGTGAGFFVCVCVWGFVWVFSTHPPEGVSLVFALFCSTR